MKVIARLERLGDNPETWLRRVGYAMLPANQEGVVSFSRRFSRDFYPRFHIYFKIKQDKEGNKYIVFNLHLDQKKPGYKGVNRHNAEYDGEVVEREVLRLKSLLLPELFA
ncbi:MAG: hypothetical protein PF488_02645 [Patescibacteria group bacterium]|jgi:hypothetical protein|nr:hypothetical protein [Patescibacteria group bacterium]